MVAIVDQIRLTPSHFDLSLRNYDADSLRMSLSDIQSAEDINKWRAHNHDAAEYIAHLIRHGLFEEGSPLREDFLNGRWRVPDEIKNAIEIVDGVRIVDESSLENVNLLTNELMRIDNVDMDGSQAMDFGQSRADQLRELESDQEIHTDLLQFLADTLGVPMVNIFTGGVTEGRGGHAMALIRTPYQDALGQWVYDVMDPMTLDPKVGLPLQDAYDKESAFIALGNIERGNAIGLHFIHERVEYDLFGQIGDGKDSLFEIIRQAGVAKLQEGESVNCQLMSLLIQAYLWCFYGSIHLEQDAGGLAGIPLGDIIKSQFLSLFNVSIKNLFDVIQKVPLPSVPQNFALSGT